MNSPKGFNLKVPDRAFTLARIMEHEYIGHGILNLSDIPNNGSRYPGRNEDEFGNVIRREMGLPLRLSYQDVRINLKTKERFAGVSFGDKKDWRNDYFYRFNPAGLSPTQKYLSIVNP